MKLLSKSKDGGPESPVEAYFLIEFKPLFSVALLKFNPGSRENYHSHAFNAMTWFIKGSMIEIMADGSRHWYRRSLCPKVTPRDRLHKVWSYSTSWCITVRGPWHKSWLEYDPVRDRTIRLGNGRKIVTERPGLRQ